MQFIQHTTYYSVYKYYQTCERMKSNTAGAIGIGNTTCKYNRHISSSPISTFSFCMAVFSMSKGLCMILGYSLYDEEYMYDAFV